MTKVTPNYISYRFNPSTNILPIHFFIDFHITSEAENAFYFLANLLYDDYYDEEVKERFSSPKDLAEDISDMINELQDDDSKEYRKALEAVSCVLLTYFSKH